MGSAKSVRPFVGSAVKEHLILGIDKHDAEEQLDLWLSENPAIKVLRVHPLRREPQSLLMRLGSRNVPRFSITLDYEEADVSNE
jgi:hypothetical protein